MNYSLYIGVFVSLVLIGCVLAPFWLGPGGLLAASSSITSEAQLEALKAALLQRYLEDEQAFKNKMLSQLAWQRRREFLVNRYVDATRRLDYLVHLKSEENS